MNVLQNGFRDDCIEGIVFERQKMSITDEIDFRGRLDFEVNDVWRTAPIACTEVQNSRVMTKLLKQTFNASVPAWGGIRASNEEGQKPVLSESAFQA